MNLINSIIDLANKALDEDSDISFLDRILGSSLLFLILAGLLIASAILFATGPIWGIPYILYKQTTEKKDESY